MSNLRKAIDELINVQDEENVVNATDLVKMIRLNLISIEFLDWCITYSKVYSDEDRDIDLV